MSSTKAKFGTSTEKHAERHKERKERKEETTACSDESIPKTIENPAEETL
jgi:hypothetical protein